MVLIYENSIFNKVGSNNKIVGAKIEVKTAMSTSKNLVKLFFAKSQLFAENSGLDFLTLRARQAFIKLKQAFIKASIFYHFHLESHICIKTDAYSDAIDRVLSQLNSNNLGR